MAVDVVEMEAEKMTCPHCNKPVLMRWQMAYYELGEGSPQFLGLEKAASAEALREKTYPKTKRISFLARREDQPPKRVSFTIQSKATKLETHLFDALDNLISQLYADGITALGERKANNALKEYAAKYGQRHDGKSRN